MIGDADSCGICTELVGTASAVEAFVVIYFDVVHEERDSLCSTIGETCPILQGGLLSISACEIG